MIAETLAQLSTVFRRRFLFNALLPTLVFSSVLAAVVTARIGSFHQVADWWARLDALSKALAALAYIAAGWFLAAAVASQWRAIVQLFEGYPALRLLGRRAPGMLWHEAARRSLWQGAGSADPDRAYMKYAWLNDVDEGAGEEEEGDDQDVMPTRLGNILIAGERYAWQRYGMETILFWPRLFPLLPSEFQANYEEFTMNYEFPLVVSFEALVVSFVGGLAILLTGGSAVFFGLLFGGGCLTAFGFYVLSLSSAEELAEQQRTAFDLYRHLLLDQWPSPADVRDERAAFEEIYRFIVGNQEPGWARPQSLHRRRHKESGSRTG